MHPHHSSQDPVSRALALGFEPTQAGRLAFVRWSLHAGYAQFSEHITADAPVVDTQVGLDGRERLTAHVPWVEGRCTR